MTQRVPPHNLAAEASLLGAMLLSKQAIYSAIEMGVVADDFYKPSHGHIWTAMTEMHRDHYDVDPVTLTDHLRRTGMLDDIGGTGYLLELQNLVPAVSNTTRYAKIVQDTSTLRQMIAASGEIAELGFEASEDVGRSLAEAHASIARLVAAADLRLLKGYYDDMALLDPGGERDESQPWIARGVLRRHQRLLIVAKAGIGKSVWLRQLAFCCANGVHPYTGQPTERARNALVVELEAGDWDIASTMRDLLFALQRPLQTASVWDVNRPALLHRAGGIDLRSAQGYAILEAAIRRSEPELVVMGPVKYLSIAKPGENYEIAALNLMGLLNELLDRYDFALCMEVHFSRGDHGAPGGSERWVDWPDVGFGLHPPSDDVTARLATGGTGTVITVKQFRNPRDSAIWLPGEFVRGADHQLPWHVEDRPDPYRFGTTVYASRYGGMPQAAFNPNVQGEF